MNILHTILKGLRQASRVPGILFLLWLVNLLFAVPVSLMIHEALADSFGSSLVAHNMRAGFDRGWHAEFESKAGDLEKTFDPTVSGAGPVLANLEAWWSGGMLSGTHPGIVALGLGYAVLWAFLLGGVLDRLARPHQPPALARFFASGGKFFPRFLGLALISGVAYFLIYQVGRQLYRWIETGSHDVTAEKTVFVQVLAASALVVLLLSVVRMVFDYAKIATVLEDRRGVFRIAWQAMRFVLSRPRATFGVTIGFGALGALLFALYLWLAPGAGQSTVAGVALAFVFSQAYLVARLVVRIGLLGGQMNLYRSKGRPPLD